MHKGHQVLATNSLSLGSSDPAGCFSSLPPNEGAGRVECAVGRTVADLAISDARLHAPRERPFFPARVHGVVATTRRVLPARGLSSKPYAGAVVQGFEPNHPGPSGFSPRRQCRQRSFRLATRCGSGGLTPGPCPSRNWLPRRSAKVLSRKGPTPSSLRADGHAGRRLSIPKLRSTSKPPSGQARALSLRFAGVESSSGG